LKNFTQEYMAASLNLSPNGYGKIERDEVDVTLGRLEEVAKILEVDYQQILNFDEKQIFNLANNKNANGVLHTQNNYNGDICQQLITELKEENKHLREEKNALMKLLEKRFV
jgi:transcriptional regulator with XRE-family HTH domain